MTLPRDRRQQARQPRRALRNVLEPAPLLGSPHLPRPERALHRRQQLGEESIEAEEPDESAVGGIERVARFVEETTEGGRDGGGEAAGREGFEFVFGGRGEEGWREAAMER